MIGVEKIEEPLKAQKLRRFEHEMMMDKKKLP